MRTCKICKQDLEDTNFSQSKKGAFSPYCRTCDAAKARENYARNKEARLQKAKERYEADRETKLTYQKEYVEKNRDSVLQKKRERWAKHRDKHSESRKAAYHANPEHYQQYARKYRRKHKPDIVKSDLSGQVFGRWSVIHSLDEYNRIFACICECGKERQIHRRKLLTGKTSSCGCLRIDTLTKHTHLHALSEAQDVPWNTVRRWMAYYQEEVVVRLISTYKQHGPTDIERYASTLLNLPIHGVFLTDIKRKPDFVLTGKAYLDVDGLYYHSEQFRDRHYHTKKRKEYEEVGKRLIQVYASELRDRPEVVLSMVNHARGLTKNRLYARKCEIDNVDQEEASEFLDENHLMGRGGVGFKAYGLIHEDRLAGLMTVKMKQGVLDIIRFCTKTHTSVAGGFHRLLKHAIQENNPTSVTNFVDLRYGTGEHLTKYGFVLESVTTGFRWTDSDNTFNRLECRADSERGLTEQEVANEKKWRRIWDAGQAKFTLTL